ncbi:sugar phosphate isomerase/epimerase [Flavisolibacter sp. BT320]|nr:sugar phosphate isomerase/epimerase [Flavisolibacter longurius]
MNTSRRTFIKQTSFAMVGATLASQSLLATSRKNQLTGIQLYSVRDDMRKEPLPTLQALAGMGYKYVEHANYVDRKFYGYSPKEFRKVLDDLGMKMPSGHTVMHSRHWNTAKEFTDAWKFTVEDAAVLGQEFVISPSMEEKQRRNYDELMILLEMFNKSGELCKKHGMKFGYHNHEFEFSEKLNGEVLYDIIMKNTDPALVIHQLDIGNMYNANAKAADVIKKYPGRFESMHVKDEIKATGKEERHQYESTLLGKGVINVKEVLELGKKSGGTKHFIIEQESYQGQKPLDAMRENIAIMKKWGY